MRKYIILVFISLFFPAFPAFSQTVDAASLTIAWTDASTNETSFKIERSLLVAGPFVEIVSLAANTQLYVDTNLAENQDYSYKLRACNAGGCSPYTPVATGRTKISIPNTPTGLTVTP